MSTVETAKAFGLSCNDLPAERYHADPAIGASMLEDFRASRRRYEALYITKTILGGEPSDAMQLGTWLHTRILEPERYFDTLADPLPEVAPDGKNWLRRKGSEHERLWAEELAKRAGKIAINEATRKKIEDIAESVLSKRWATRLLRGDGQPEFSIFWTDRETGLDLKCRVDWFSAICTDLKSTADPSPAKYAKSLVNLGYHRKLAHYRAGISAYTGEDATFIHVAVGTEAPYSCGAYSIDDRDLMDARTPRVGEQQWRRTLRALAECYETGDWSDPFEREILDLRLPQWAFTEDSYQL